MSDWKILRNHVQTCVYVQIRNNKLEIIDDFKEKILQQQSLDKKLINNLYRSFNYTRSYRVCYNFI